MSIFCRREGAWKFAYYAEAPQAPLTMVRKFGHTAKSVSREELNAALRTILALQADAVPEDFAGWVEGRKQGAD